MSIRLILYLPVTITVIISIFNFGVINAWTDVINGTAGNDSLMGTDTQDTMRGFSGNDFLFGLDNIDLIYGNEGNDSLTRANGNDELYGNEGKDGVAGNRNNDLPRFKSSFVDGNDIIYGDGDEGNYELYGQDKGAMMY